MNHSRPPLRTRLTLASVVLVGLLSAAGCMPPPLPYANITGTVTVDGAPVPGTIYFWYPVDESTAPAEGVSAPLDAQGSFSILLMLGPQYPISLTNPQAPLPGPIPDFYADPAKSGLKAFPMDTGPLTLDIRISSQYPTSNQVILK